VTAGSLLVCVAVIALAAALREAGAARAARTNADAGGRGSDPGRAGAGVGRKTGLLATLGGLVPDAATRIERAGGAGGLTVTGLATVRLGGLAAGLLLGLALVPALPGRFGPLATGALAIGGLMLPDLALERAARRRRRQVVAVLPDAIEVLAVGYGGGRSTRAGIGALARAGSGTLARELSVTAAEIECGVPPSRALASLRRRVPGPELAGLTIAIERSARLGSPLSEQLHRQSASLRDTRRRRMTEQAARAAPKIQLVIALILVPAVLLMIAAGLIANADTLLSGF